MVYSALLCSWVEPMRGHGSLQAMLGRATHATPKRRRDNEDEFVQEASGLLPKRPDTAPPQAASQGSGQPVRKVTGKAASKSSSKQASASPEPVWDWANNKRVARARSAPQMAPVPPVAAATATPVLVPGQTTLMCSVVGRKHRAPSPGLDQALLGAAPGARVEVRVAREPTNPVDANALQVLWDDLHKPTASSSTPQQSSSHLLGHVPAKLAQHLSPLMDAGFITIRGHVQLFTPPGQADTSTPAPNHTSNQPCASEQTTDTAGLQGKQLPLSSTPVHDSTITDVQCAGGSEGGAGGSASASLGAPAAALGPGPSTTCLSLHMTCLVSPGLVPGDAAAVGLRLDAAHQAARELSVDTGKVLRDKFVIMVDHLGELDAHVFSAEERTTMATLRALPAPQLSLLLRLFLRRGPWFVLQDVDYKEVGSAEQSGAALVSCGCMQLPSQGDCTQLLQMLPVHRALDLALSLGVVGVGSSSRRADVDEALRPTCTCTRTSTQRCLERSASLGSQGAVQRRHSSDRPTVALPNHASDAQQRRPPRPPPAQRPSNAAAGSSAQHILIVLSDDDEPMHPVSPYATAAAALKTEGTGGDEGGSPGVHAAPAALQGQVACGGEGGPTGVQPHELAGTPAGAAAVTVGPQWVIDLTGDDPQPAAVPVTGNAGVPPALPALHASSTCVDTGSDSNHRGAGQQWSLPATPAACPDTNTPASEAPCLGTAMPAAAAAAAESIGDRPRASVQEPATSGPTAAANQPPLCRQQDSTSCAPLVRAGSSGGGTAGCTLQKHLMQLVGPCVRVPTHVTQLILRMQRVYFLSESHDVSRWVATERGALPYPPYRVNRIHSAFPTRQVLLEYEAALGHAALLDDCLNSGNTQGAEEALAPAWGALAAGQLKSIVWTERPATLQGAAGQPGNAGPGAEVASGQAGDGTVQGSGQACPPPPLYLARFCAAWVYTGMCTVGVSLHEKARRYGDAVRCLRALLDGTCCPGRRGEWWLRLSIDLEHQGDDEGALVAGEQSLKDPWVRHGDLLALQRRVLRLGKPPRRWKKPGWAAAVSAEPPEVVIVGRPLNNTTGVKSRFFSTDVDGRHVGVEALALEHYASEAGGGWQGLHCEGGVWASLFALLLWDCLFVDLPDVFRTPFQTAPLDLESDAFYPARRDMIDSRLQEIASGGAEQLLGQCWQAHRGQWCRGVHWDHYPLEQLQEIARCVGGLGLSVVCRMLAEDYGGWRGGMPDLLLWRPVQGDAKLSEVKGPRDRLSDAQRAWMAALSAVGVQCEVLRVQEPKL